MKKKLSIINISQIKTRTTWAFNSVTRTIPSKKVYIRKNKHAGSCYL